MIKQLALAAMAWVLLAAPALTRAEARDADFIFAVGDEHVHLDPQKISWVSDWRIVACLYEGLVRYNATDLSIEPGVAEKWTLSEDKRTWTFNLRKEAKWSNGDAVTAGDFVYAWRRVLLTGSDYTELMYRIKGARAFFQWRNSNLTAGAEKTAEQFASTVGLSAPDDHTLVVTLEHPTPYFIELCAFVTFLPAHRKSVEAVTTLDASTGMITEDAAYWSDPQRLVCNGAFVLKRRRFKQDMLLNANDKYWNHAATRSASILERVISEPQARIIAYTNGDIDWLPDVNTAGPEAVNLVRQNRPDVHVVPMAGVYFYNFNCLPKLPNGQNNPLADARVRRALSMAIDRQTLVTKVTRLNQPLTKTFVPKGALEGYEPPAEAGIGFDVAQAKKLLAEAGYADGKGLSGLSILYNTGFGHEAAAQAIKRMWETNLGVSVSLDGVEGKSFAERIKKQDFTISRANWFGDYRDATTWLDKLATGNGNNDCAYSNPAYDAMLAEAEAMADAKARIGKLRDAEAMMLADSPMAMLYQHISIYLYDPKKVQGMTSNAWGVWRLEQVKVGR